MTIIYLNNNLRNSTSPNINSQNGVRLDSENQGNSIEGRRRKETQSLGCLTNIRNVPRRARSQCKRY